MHRLQLVPVRSTLPYDEVRTTSRDPGVPAQTPAWQVSPATPHVVPSANGSPTASHFPVAHDRAPDPWQGSGDGHQVAGPHEEHHPPAHTRASPQLVPSSSGGPSAQVPEVGP
jgi:hypothetical protein